MCNKNTSSNKMFNKYALNLCWIDENKWFFFGFPSLLFVRVWFAYTPSCMLWLYDGVNVNIIIIVSVYSEQILSCLSVLKPSKICLLCVFWYLMHVRAPIVDWYIRNSEQFMQSSKQSIYIRMHIFSHIHAQSINKQSHTHFQE